MKWAAGYFWFLRRVGKTYVIQVYRRYFLEKLNFQTNYEEKRYNKHHELGSTPLDGGRNGGTPQSILWHQSLVLRSAPCMQIRIHVVLARTRDVQKRLLHIRSIT